MRTQQHHQVAFAEPPPQTTASREDQMRLAVTRLWQQAKTPTGAGQIDLQYNLDMLLPKIIRAVATCDGDLCDLGHVVRGLVANRFQQIARGNA